jgi:hypothetical protein
VIEWWTAQQSNVVGGVGGALVGVLGGGVLGPAIGVCAPRGLLKAPVLAMHGLLIILGVCALGAGVCANLSGQPGHVYRPLMLMGSIGTGVLGGLLPVTLWAYRLADARKPGSRDSADPPPRDPNFRAPNAAVIRAVVDAWSRGGPLRRLCLRLAALMSLLALGGVVAASVVAARGGARTEWYPWTLLVIGPGVAGVVCWMLPRSMLATANAGRGVLDQQRLAAEELRRG